MEIGKLADASVSSTVVTLNLFQGPWPNLSSTPCFLFRTKTQSHEEESFGRQAHHSRQRCGGLCRRKGKPLRGPHNIFVALCLCAKLKLAPP
jgi:hypothetical protein